MNRLLDKPFQSFSIYALIILVCSIPVYYFVVDTIWLDELDEHNTIIRQQIEQNIRKIDTQESDLDKTLNIWNSLQPGIAFTPLQTSEIYKDSIYTATSYNKFAKETDRFRVLSTTIFIQKKPYHLVISTNVEETDETLLVVAIITAFFFLVLVLGFVFLNKRIARNSWKPFYRTLEQLKRFDLNKDQHIELEESDILEFEELNTALTTLIEKNTLAFNQQKRFIENASHELQTPLAILKTKADVLLQNEHLNEKLSAIIAAINSNLARISRINKNMLLLAKIENNQFPEKANTNLKEAVEETVDSLTDYGLNKGMDIRMDLQSYPLYCNSTLLEVLLNNLLTNAIRHGEVNQPVLISMKDNKLIFSNRGKQALKPEQLFVRFAISSSETTNSGLGLSISKEICDQNRWKISYTFIDHFHVFSIEF
ncbi:HAMP domain-containing sensor histidine kinase [Fluviicola sp.]|uniref:sensor histidine kinase n=1 Tax=Fluviicola sp. TaxID=1917219 RepID=UPI00282AA7E8|nr:HAMP domain-containing sensor histidine kinase [Fluviicola sp.]MDR0801897.1 HAMP domain-containing histidine kinase [Fluviicola sp.]